MATFLPFISTVFIALSAIFVATGWYFVALGDLAVHTGTDHQAAIALSEISEQPQYHH